MFLGTHEPRLDEKGRLILPAKFRDDLSPGLGQYQRDRTRVMGAYRASTLIDFENARPLELEALFRKPLAAARVAGVDTPRLAKLCTVLEQLVAEQKNSVINGN